MYEKDKEQIIEELLTDAKNNLLTQQIWEGYFQSRLISNDGGKELWTQRLASCQAAQKEGKYMVDYWTRKLEEIEKK